MKRIFQVSSAILPFKPNTKVPPTLIAGPWKRYFAGRWGGARLSFIRRSEAIWRVRNGERLWNQVTWGKAGSPEHFRLDERSHTGDLLFVSNNLEGSLVTQGSDISMTAKGRNRTRTNQRKKKGVLFHISSFHLQVRKRAWTGAGQCLITGKTQAGWAVVRNTLSKANMKRS